MGDVAALVAHAALERLPVQELPEQHGIEVIAMPDVEREILAAAWALAALAARRAAMKNRSGCACTSAPLTRASTLWTNCVMVRLSSIEANG